MFSVVEEANRLFEYTQFLRRDFHQHPELGFQEYRTSEIVARELKTFGLNVQTGIAETGVSALIEGSKKTPVTLIRFDMDALPIQEETGATYASINPGVMHACGHDAHTAVGITVAKILQSHKKEIPGTVKLVFQPAEEGLGGAEKMVKDGILENPKPDFSLALHVWNEKPVGWIGMNPGPIMAAADQFQISIFGKGGHGAAPNLTHDPVLTASEIILALQSIVSRNISPLKKAVVSATRVHGGDAFNIIPSKVEIEGTIRTFEPEVREEVINRLKQIASHVGEAHECTVESRVVPYTPAVVNDKEMTVSLSKMAKQLFPDSEVDLTAQTMGSEDMAFLMNEIPGCFFFVGSANHEKGLDASHHHPMFDIDEQVLPEAVALMVSSVFTVLRDRGE